MTGEIGAVELREVAEAAHGWIDRCTQIGFAARQTELLADMLSARITSLQRPAG